MKNEEEVYGDVKIGRWNIEEHSKFKEAVMLYGQDLEKVAAHIGTRTAE